MKNLQQLLTDNKIEWLEFSVVDLSAQARGRIISADGFDAGARQKLPLDILMETVNGRFAEVIKKGHATNEEDTDMLLVADERTAVILPWLKQPTLSVICDAFDLKGNALEQHSRQLLKRVLKLYQAHNWQPMVAPELEFFLFQPLRAGERELKLVNGKNNKILSTRQPYSVERIGEFDTFFNDVIDNARLQGIHITSLIQEVANGQFEVNLAHGDALTKADEVLQIKRTIREVAKSHGMHASFMAKPLADAPGCSMHLHQSVLDSNTQQNIFSTDKGENSALFNGYIGGLKKYLPEGIALLFPFVNSYRRLQSGLCAPLNTEWAYDNRTVGLRIPAKFRDKSSFDTNRRIENRLAGADCNPYLAFALSLALGYEGMVNNIDPGPAFSGSAYEIPITFANTLDNALDALQQSSVLKKLLGEDFIRTYHAVKSKELDDFNQFITPWEITNLSGVI